MESQRARILQASSGAMLSAVLCVLLAWLGFSLDSPPWNIMAWTLAVMLGLWAIVGTAAVSGWFNSAKPEQVAAPEEPDAYARLGWDRADMEVPALAYRTESNFVYSYNGPEADLLTPDDIEAIVRHIYTARKISRRYVCQCMLPSTGRRLKQATYEPFMSILVDRKIVADRGPRREGRLKPPTVEHALMCFEFYQDRLEAARQGRSGIELAESGLDWSGLANQASIIDLKVPANREDARPSLPPRRNGDGDRHRALMTEYRPSPSVIPDAPNGMTVFIKPPCQHAIEVRHSSGRTGWMCKVKCPKSQALGWWFWLAGRQA